PRSIQTLRSGAVQWRCKANVCSRMASINGALQMFGREKGGHSAKLFVSNHTGLTFCWTSRYKSGNSTGYKQLVVWRSYGIKSPRVPAPTAFADPGRDAENHPRRVAQSTDTFRIRVAKSK